MCCQVLISAPTVFDTEDGPGAEQEISLWDLGQDGSECQTTRAINPNTDAKYKKPHRGSRDSSLCSSRTMNVRLVLVKPIPRCRCTRFQNSDFGSVAVIFCLFYPAGASDYLLGIDTRIHTRTHIDTRIHTHT